MPPIVEKGGITMTIIEAINRLDKIKPNGYGQEDKIEWLSEIDGMVKQTVTDTHEGGEDISFTGYDATTPLDTVLLIPSPYDSAYLDWLSAKIDFADGEYARYNNSMTRFNDTFLAFSRFYNRKYMPKGAKFKYF